MGGVTVIKNKLWAACLALVLANLAILFYVYGNLTQGEDKIAAQNISRLISTYAEPESNPVFLVRSEDRCRFYGKLYCPMAKQQRVATMNLFTNPTQLTSTTTTVTTMYYLDYLNARSDLVEATRKYVAFLNTNPLTPQYLAASIAFEQQAGELIAAIVTNLYALQDETLRESEKSGNWGFTLGYLCNLLLIALMIFARRTTTQKGG
jgi:hypothetical protein